MSKNLFRYTTKIRCFATWDDCFKLQYRHFKA